MTRPTLTKILTLLVLLAAAGLVAGLRIAATAKERAAPGAANSGAAADAALATRDAPAGADEGAAPAQKAVTYPVVTTAPVPRRFKQVVRGYGAIRADARSARSVSMATVGIVRSVEVLPGERVKQGQPLFTVEPDPLAYLAYQQAASAAKLARAEVARLTAQRADQLATETQLESAQKALADAEAGVEAARRQGAAGAAEVLRAPVDGIVTALGAGIGDRPAVGAPLAAIAPANAARALLGVEPGEARLVHVGDRVTVRPVQSGPGERTGHVVVVGAALDKDTRLVSVAVALDQAGFDDYLAGSAVEAAIETRTLDAFSVPRSAIVKDEEGTAVFEIAAGKAHRVPVVIEVDEGARVGISGALDKARPVVTTGAYELEDGAAIAEQRR